jgi:formylglycine-generating enzyme required for sulfatase activity
MAVAGQALAQGDKPWLRPGAHAGEQIAGPDGGTMVWVPPGEFEMGAPDGDADERPVHRVRVSRGFWLSRCEMTVAQWKQYCQAAQVPQTKSIFVPDTHPMSGVSWSDAREYCRFFGLALPTEAQWEWAARGPEGRKYPWGNQWNPLLCCNSENPAEPVDDAPIAYTAPVGSFPGGASWCGALDMAGNLSEWCADWYAEDFYATSPETDPTGPEAGSEKVWRGGYCWGDAEECRSANRFSSEPDNDGGAGCLRACIVP